MLPETGVYGWSPGNGGVHHYRIAEPLRVAALHNIPTATGRELTHEICERYDTILAHMLHHEHALPAWRQLAERGHHRLVLDVDDAMWAPDWQPFRDAYTPEVLDRLYTAIQLAHVVTTPSPVIAASLGCYHPNVRVIANYVPAYLLHQHPRTRRRPTIGYQGSASHDPDISPEFIGCMRRFARDYPEWIWKMWGKTPREVEGWPPGFIQTVPWQPDLRAYYRSLSMDVGIGPLKSSTFTASKSSLRAVEYAALGVPAVLSRSPAYEGWVEQGVTGFLVEDDQDWYQLLSWLAEDPQLAVKMGYAARERAESWTTEGNIWRWSEAWNSV